MADDLVARIREAVEQARRAAGQEPPERAVPLLLDALEQLAKTQQNLAVQQELLDDRLLRVERNRLFTLFNRFVLNITNLARRTGLLKDTGDSSAYATWVEHESAELPSVESARAAARNWQNRPKISLIMSIRRGEKLAECVTSLASQAYDNWELCAAGRSEMRASTGRFPRLPAHHSGRRFR